MKVILFIALAHGCLGVALVDKKAVCADICPEYYSPLCGSDGQTYSNDCFFQAAQCHDNTLTLLHKGTCGSGGGAHLACPDMMCPAVYAPVCGTDGNTYSNECELHSTHCHGDVTVAYKSPCLGPIVS